MKNELMFASWLVLIVLMLAGCVSVEDADLVIENASLFNARTKTVEADCTIVIRDGRIADILNGKDGARYAAGTTIDADGRLVTPGFIDVHHHTASVLADSVTSGGGEVADLTMHPDSIAAYRDAFAREYMPYGITVVREAGGDENYLALMLAWMKPDPRYPDFYPAGGAVVSHEEGRTPYSGHVVVTDPDDARAKVQAYYDAGIRHIKLYWRLREPEFDAALERALALDMNTFGHIDYKIVSIDHALDRGLKHFEHAIPFVVDVLEPEEIQTVWQSPAVDAMREKGKALYFFYTMELCNFLGSDNPKMLELIRRLRANDATVTPTLHIFAQRFGLTYFTSESVGDFDDTSPWTEAEMERARAGYGILAAYVKRLFDDGVPLNLGTDCADPGKAALSELLMLHEAGIPIRDVLVIATWNSAQSTGLGESYGSIEVGKNANLIIFEENPLADPRHLLSEKTIIKDGAVWTNQ